jgi:tetratricopeptide (TPR) repeat protein
MRIPAAFELIAVSCFGIAHLHSADWASEHSLATLAYDQGDYAGAEQHDRAALALAESSGQNDLRVEAILTQLSASLQARSTCCEAEQLTTRALAIRKALFGENSIETALGQHNLAAVWQQSGRSEEAGKLQAQSLAAAERLLPPDNPKLVPFLTLAALIERDAKRYDRAEALLKRARVLAESDAVEHPRQLMEVWKYMGSVYRSAGRFEDAERAYRTLIDLSEATFGADKMDTAKALANLGGILCQRKSYAAAYPYLARAVDTYQRIHETGFAYFSVLESLSSAELYLGQANSAEQHALLALSVVQKQPAVDCDILATAYNNLGQIYAQQGRYPEAERATTRAKEIWLGTLGPNSSKVAAVLSNLGALYVHEHKYKKAEALYDQSAAIDSKVSGTSSLDYARDLNRLGVLYNDEKRYTKSEKALREALEIDSKKVAKDSPVLAEPYINLAFSLYAQHRREEALEDFQRGIEIMTKAGQAKTPNMAVVLNQYSALLREMSRFADAEKASTEALGIVVKEKINGETYR